MPEGLPILNPEQPTPAVQPMNGKEEAAPILAYAVGDYTVIRITYSDDLSRRLFPKFVERAIGFIDRTNADTDRIWLGSLLYGAFSNSSPHVLMLMAVNKEEKIVAHAVAYPEVRGNLGWIGHLLQIEKDKEVRDSEVFKVGMRLIDEWKKSIGLKDLLNQTDSLAKVRYFERYGFKLYRYITRK